jgi:hypothetical protein
VRIERMFALLAQFLVNHRVDPRRWDEEEGV